MTNVVSIISTSEVIPTIDSNLFRKHPDNHLAVGIVAMGGSVVPGLEEEYQGYLLLRGNVYAKQKNYMPVAELNDDGTETDLDDARSVHFAIVENALTSVRVVGAMRLIIKSTKDSRPLPIEEHYPEAFSGAPAPLLSTEASRLISQHEDRSVAAGAKWLLFGAGVKYVGRHGLGPVYGAVEPLLARSLNTQGVPVTALCSPKYVPEFNATKLAIRVDVPGLIKTLEDDMPDLVDAMNMKQGNFVYQGLVSPIEIAESAAI